MNFIKRAIKSVKERKGKSLLILSIMLTVCIVILTSFSIQSATEVASVMARQKLGANVSLVADMDKLKEQMMSEAESGERFKPQPTPLPIEYLKELKSSDYVNDYYITSNTFANLEELEAVGSEEETDVVNNKMPMKNTGDVAISGINNLNMDLKVQNGYVKLIEGREITEDDLGENVALVEKTFIYENELSLGDTINISSIDETQSLEIEIVGIYEDSSEISSNAFMQTAMLPYNNIYVPYTIANILKGEEYENAVDSIIFSLDDPKNIEKFIQEANNTSIDFETFKLDAGDNAYETMMGPIENVASFSKTTLIMVSIFGGVILSLIVMLSIKDRTHEIGILMSLGEKKSKIVGQLLTETFIVLLLSLSIAGLSGNIISSEVGNVLLQNEIATQNEQSEEINGFKGNRPSMGGFNNMKLQDIDPIEDLDIKVSEDDFIKMSGASFIVSIIATLVPSIFVMRLNPKDILSRHN